ncbi:unnamed protein product [Leptosia nina]|uniref:Uncharacterized protein n=1 Tax=Leptosia nina TaxID=320188 RepID=A0AAV1J841_9NEOP
MVNYKRIVCEAAVLAALLSLAAAAPVPDCEKSEKHFDQRQNGTENYRLNIDGVVIAVAPAESLLAAASDIDLSDLLDIEDFNELKPKPPNKPIRPKPEDDKPLEKPDEKPETPLSDVTLTNEVKQKKDASQRNKEKSQRLKYRLASMLLPLLRRNRNH